MEESGKVFPKSMLEDFALKVDRIMGTAHTFAQLAPGHRPFEQLGNLAALCKATGYKATTLNIPELIPIFAAFWADTIDIMQEITDNIDNQTKLREATQEYLPVLQKRLVWLAQQIISMTKGSSAGESTINVDGLLKKLGLDI